MRKLPLSSAVRTLREAKFTCPGPLDSATGLPTTGHLFRVGASQHQIKQRKLDKSYSTPKRIQHDIDRSSELAALLDDSKNIPEDTRLGRLISEEFVGHLRQPADLLDVTVAYLRRVHFVDYFSGMRYIDEGHLLSRMSNIVVRSVPASSVFSESKGDITARGGDEIISIVGNGRINDQDADERPDGYWRRRGGADGSDEDNVQHESEEAGVAEEDNRAKDKERAPEMKTAYSTILNHVSNNTNVDVVNKISVLQKLSDWKKDILDLAGARPMITASDR